MTTWRWIIGADVEGWTVAPAGLYTPRVRYEGRHLLHALDLAGLRPEDAVGRRVVVRPGQPPALLPELLAGPRPALLCESPPDLPFGLRPLEGASGARLARVLGVSLAQLLASFDCRYIVAADGALRIPDAGLRDVVVLGHGAADVLAAAHGCRREDLPGRAIGGGIVRAVLPHPTRRCFEWNDPRTAFRARAELLGALAAIRGHALAGPDLFEVARTAPPGSPAHRLAMRDLADAGVLAQPVEPGAAWRRAQAAGSFERWERRYADAAAVVVGPPWACDAWGRPLGGRFPSVAAAVEHVEARAVELGLVEVAAAWPRNVLRVRPCWCGAAPGLGCDPAAVPPDGTGRADGVAVRHPHHPADPVHVGRAPAGLGEIGGWHA